MNKKILITIIVIVLLSGVGIFAWLQFAEPELRVKEKPGHYLTQDEDIVQDPPPIEMLKIKNISPASGLVGTKIIINGFGFHPTDNDIAFLSPETYWQGRNRPAYVNYIPSQDGTTLSFNLPELLGACAMSLLGEGEGCPDFGITLPEGVVQISVVNRNGESNSLPFTVR